MLKYRQSQGLSLGPSFGLEGRDLTNCANYTKPGMCWHLDFLIIVMQLKTFYPFKCSFRQKENILRSPFQTLIFYKNPILSIVLIVHYGQTKQSLRDFLERVGEHIYINTQ